MHLLAQNKQAGLFSRSYSRIVNLIHVFTDKDFLKMESREVNHLKTNTSGICRHNKNNTI